MNSWCLTLEVQRSQGSWSEIRGTGNSSTCFVKGMTRQYSALIKISVYLSCIDNLSDASIFPCFLFKGWCKNSSDFSRLVFPAKPSVSVSILQVLFPFFSIISTRTTTTTTSLLPLRPLPLPLRPLPPTTTATATTMTTTKTLTTTTTTRRRRQ